MSYQGVPATPPLLSPVWEAALARCNADATLVGLLGGEYVGVAYMPLPGEPTQTGQWQRVVLLPITTAWPLPEQPGRSVVAPFSMRVDVHMPSPNANPAPKLEQVHRRLFELLHGWVPGALAGATVRLRVWRETPPTTSPLWDEAGDHHYMAAEYRAVVEPPTI